MDYKCLQLMIPLQPRNRNRAFGFHIERRGKRVREIRAVTGRRRNSTIPPIRGVRPDGRALDRFAGSRAQHPFARISRRGDWQNRTYRNRSSKRSRQPERASAYLRLQSIVVHSTERHFTCHGCVPFSLFYQRVISLYAANYIIRRSNNQRVEFVFYDSTRLQADSVFTPYPFLELSRHGLSGIFR